MTDSKIIQSGRKQADDCLGRIRAELPGWKPPFGF